MKRNIALKLMYNGTAYHGWQVQKRDVTVAGTLEKALSGLAGERIHLVGAGRTDAGVHAEHYIANFRTTMTIPCDRLPLAINVRLPEDIGLRGGGGFQRHRLVPEKRVYLPHLQLPHQQPVLCPPRLFLP